MPRTSACTSARTCICTTRTSACTTFVPMSDELVTLAQAAELCRLAKSTMTRRRANGDFPNAQKHDGVWHVPVYDLIAANLLDTVRRQDDKEETKDARTSAASAEDPQEASARTSALEKDLFKASAELELAHQQAKHWKEIADERQALADHWKTLTEQQQRQIESLNTKVLELEAPEPTRPQPETPEPVQEANPTGLLGKISRLFRP
jgi:hypothetical protein